MRPLFPILRIISEDHGSLPVHKSEKLARIHGGLQLQVTHHLFPRLPRHNLKKASLLVKQFAAENGLTYAEFGFIAGNKDVIGVLRNVAEQVKIVGMVAQSEVGEAVEKSTPELKNKQG